MIFEVGKILARRTLTRILTPSAAPPLQTMAAAAEDESKVAAPAVKELWPFVHEAPPDAIFGLAREYHFDPHADKLTFVVGAYRTEDGKPWVLPTVRKAEKLIVKNEMNHEYLPQDGHKGFRDAAADLLYAPHLSTFCVGTMHPRHVAARLHVWSSVAACHR